MRIRSGVYPCSGVSWSRSSSEPSLYLCLEQVQLGVNRNLEHGSSAGIPRGGKPGGGRSGPAGARSNSGQGSWRGPCMRDRTPAWRQPGRYRASKRSKTRNISWRQLGVNEQSACLAFKNTYVALRCAVLMAGVPTGILPLPSAIGEGQNNQLSGECQKHLKDPRFRSWAHLRR